MTTGTQMTTITEAFELPRPEFIGAMGFVVRLREADPDSDEVKRLVDDYVITPAVERELPGILDGMKQVFDRGEEYGRFIHGSFGSGKSHFMTMLSLHLESAVPARTQFRPLFNAHRDTQLSKGIAALDREPWLSGATGPSREMIEDWRKRFPPPNTRAARSQRTPRRKSATPEEGEES